MTLIKISEDGLNGKKVNPYSVDYSQYKHDEFENDNPSYQLTEQGEPNSEVEAELVWQKSQKHTKIWHNVEQQDYITYNNFRNFARCVDEKGYETRQAWQISKPKVETLDFQKTDEGEVIGYLSFKEGDLHIEPAIPQIAKEPPTAEVTEQSIEEAAEKELDRANSKLFSAFVKSLLDSSGYTVAKLKEKDSMIFNEAYEYWVDNLPDYTDLLTKIKDLKK